MADVPLYKCKDCYHNKEMHESQFKERTVRCRLTEPYSDFPRVVLGKDYFYYVTGCPRKPEPDDTSKDFT